MHFTATPAYPNLKQSWGLIGITLAIAIVINLLLFLVMAILMTIGGESLGTAFASHSLTFLLSYIFIFSLVIFIGIQFKKKREGSFEPNFSLPSLDNLTFIVIGTLGIYFLVEPVVDLIPMPKFIEDLFLGLLGEQNIWTIVAIVVAAPILEEYLLRGIMLDGLLKWYSPRKAIIWSALFFGILHFNPWQFVPALALGIFMGWIYWRTGSLLTMIFIHFVANGSGSLLAAIFQAESSDLVSTHDLFSNSADYFLLLTVSFIAVLISIFYLNKNMKKTIG